MLDVEVYSSFDRSGTTGFKYSYLRASLLTVLRVVYAFTISRWISSWIFYMDFRVGFSIWIFRIKIFWRDFFGGCFSTVLHNVLCQRCCTSSRGLFKIEEKENCRFNLS